MAARPIVLSVPTINIVDNVIRVPVHALTYITYIDGHLRSLVSGTFKVRVRQFDGTLIDTLEWTSSGVVSHDHNAAAPQLPSDGGLRIEVDGNGLSPQDCTVSIWIDQ